MGRTEHLFVKAGVTSRGGHRCGVESRVEVGDWGAMSCRVCALRMVFWPSVPPFRSLVFDLNRYCRPQPSTVKDCAMGAMALRTLVPHEWIEFYALS